MTGEKVAIGRQLSHCRDVITLGVKRNLRDYHKAELRLIRDAYKIYYPSFFLYSSLDKMGKKTFPNPNYYRFFNNKIKQTVLFDSLGMPHPRTRMYFGEEEKRMILKEWSFPFIAKIPERTSFGLGVYLIRNIDELNSYNRKTKIAYIQEYLLIDRDIRIVLINKRIILAYWRIMPEGEYRTNVYRGGIIHFNCIPQKALDLAEKAAGLCDFDNVGLDICEYKGEYYIFEANMGYGIEGFRQAGLDYKTVLRNLVEKDQI